MVAVDGKVQDVEVDVDVKLVEVEVDVAAAISKQKTLDYDD